MRLIITIILSSLLLAHAQPLRVSYTHMPVSMPIVLAHEMGWFEKAGVKVDLKESALGKIALEDLTKGKLDVAAAAVTPLVYKHFAGDEFKIISTIASSTGMIALAARKDFGISKIADLQGKRIGIASGTSGEFFFQTMRVLNRIPPDTVRVLDRSVDGLIHGLREGSLDVISIWEPEIQRLRNDLTNRLTLFYGNGVYTFTWSLAALPQTIQTRRSDLEKFLRVVADSAEYVEAHPVEAREQLVRRLGPKGAELSLHIDEARFRPELTQELLVQMEGEARWLITQTGRTNRAPNFLSRIDTSILKKVRPSSVTLIQ